MRPRIFIIGRTSFDSKTFSAFLQQAGTYWNRSQEASESEEIIEAAGRICYMSFGERQSPKTNEEYIRHLIKMGHESVLEHVNWTFLIEGISRAFTHQLVRHRVGFSFSQLSQQYHDETDAHFVEPMQLEKFPEAKAAWNHSIEVAREAYCKIKTAIDEEEAKLRFDSNEREGLRAIRSIARSVLPNATETKIVVTANARAIRHFLRIRGSIPGDIEMRLVATELLQLISKESPSLFFDFKIERLADNTPIVVQLAGIE